MYERERQSYDLIIAVFISAITTILTTVCIFCVVFESPPVRKTPPSLFKTFSFDVPNENRILERKRSDPTLDLTYEGTRSPRNLNAQHLRKHSS